MMKSVFYAIQFLIVIGMNNLQSMVKEVTNSSFPTLKRLSAQAYWKSHTLYPTKRNMNEDVALILTAYRALDRRCIDDQLKAALFLNDGPRIVECEMFMEKHTKKQIFLNGIKYGALQMALDNSKTTYQDSIAFEKDCYLLQYTDALVSESKIQMHVEKNHCEDCVFKSGDVIGKVCCFCCGLLCAGAMVALFMQGIIWLDSTAKHMND